MEEYKKIVVPVPDVDTTELQILSGNLNIDIPDMSKHIQNISAFHTRLTS